MAGALLIWTPFVAAATPFFAANNLLADATLIVYSGVLC
jgi:hypothetical protein